MSSWAVEQDCYERFAVRRYETLFSLANGYRGLRGHLEFSSLGEPGNYLAGHFSQGQSKVPELMNGPNPLGIRFYAESEPLDLDHCKMVSYHRELRMDRAELVARLRLETPQGRRVAVSATRFVSRSSVERWGCRYTVSPLNFSGKIHVENVLDGTATNNAYEPLEQTRHYCVEEGVDFRPGIALQVSTPDRSIAWVEASTLQSVGENGNMLRERRFQSRGDRVREVYQLWVQEGREYSVDVLGASWSSRHVDNPLARAEADLLAYAADGWDEERRLHGEAWQRLWQDMDVVIEGDERAQVGLRFNLFHLASCAYDGDDTVSIAAKGLHGEGYKGHVFWDTEVFMQPFFVYTQPSVARALLMYRYRTLEGARRNARESGYKGARFAWESASSGVETTPKWGVDYDGKPVRIWTGEEELHISADVALAVWQYVRATGDEEFLREAGLEIIFDTAQFWKSCLQYNEAEDRWEIRRVIGPDEFHEHVDNNFYTNYLARWNLQMAVRLAEITKRGEPALFGRLCAHLGIDDSDVRQWDSAASKIYLPQDEASHRIEQFEGYFELLDVPIEEYDRNGLPKWPEKLRQYPNLSLNDTQLIKQPDVVMLLFVLPDHFSMETKRANYAYYRERTMHKSSLSPSIYSIVGQQVGDRSGAHRFFMQAVMTDLEDNQGNTALGLHCASAGGCWQSAVLGFGGMAVDSEHGLQFSPWLPSTWTRLAFAIQWKGAKVQIDVDRTHVTVSSSEPVSVQVYDQPCTLKPNEAQRIARPAADTVSD